MKRKDFEEQELTGKDVPLPGGKKVYISELGAEDYLHALSLTPRDEKGDLDGNDLIFCMVLVSAKEKKDGSRIFTDEDLSFLKSRKFSFYSPMAIAAKELNGFGEKNSEASPNDGSSSGSL